MYIGSARTTKHHHLKSHQVLDMKLSTSFLLVAVTAITASPTPTYQDTPARALEKRVSITDAASVGFAMANGGTKGGAGGPTTTVSTLPQLSAAANSSGPLNIVVQGAISGAAKVQVGSDKTIIGKTGSCMRLALLSCMSPD